MLALLNERGSIGDEGIDDSGADDSIVSGGQDFSKYLNDDSLASLESDDSNEESAGANTEKASLEDQLNDLKVEGEGTADTDKLLGEINALGIIRKGLPVEFESIDQIKEYLSKENDYTQKTTALAAERQVAEQEIRELRSTAEQEIAQIRQEAEIVRDESVAEVQENQIMGQILTELQVSDPDLFEEFQAKFNQAVSQREAYSNTPEMQAMKKRFADMESKFNNTADVRTNEENAAYQKEFETGLSEVQTKFGVKLKSLGVIPDYKAVRDMWGNDASGNMTVNQAFLAVHGDNINAALEAKRKLATTKSTTSRLLNDGDAANGETAAGQSVAGNDSYLAKALKLAENL